jgi:hydroxyacylglutathione hydrolase
MPVEIHPLSLGMCNCYLVKQEGLILVDAGGPNREQKFLANLKNLSIDPANISLLLLTHAHWDHIGSANQIRESTGCHVAINHRERHIVEKALKPLPPGTNLISKIFTIVMKAYVPFVSFPGTPVDLALEDEDFSLEPYGIQGKVIHTPGHSSGSTSLLLDTGDAFVGDLAMNSFPMRIGAGLPVLADDISVVKESWRRLLSSGAKQVYPAHGKPFKADKLEKSL